MLLLQLLTALLQAWLTSRPAGNETCPRIVSQEDQTASAQWLTHHPIPLACSILADSLLGHTLHLSRMVYLSGAQLPFAATLQPVGGVGRASLRAFLCATFSCKTSQPHPPP